MYKLLLYTCTCVHVNAFHFQQALHFDHESSDRTLREKDEELNNLKQATMKLQNELSTLQTVSESNLKNSLEQLVLLNVVHVKCSTCTQYTCTFKFGCSLLNITMIKPH